MKSWKCALAGLVLGLLLAGCPSSGTQQTSGPVSPSLPGGPDGAGAPGKSYTFAIIPKMLNNPVFDLARRGAEKAAKEIGARDGVTIKIEYQSSETGDPAEQAETIGLLARTGVDGMSISVVDANTVKGPIDDALAEGIKVITFDSDAPGSKRITFYAVSDEKLGREVAERMVEACGGKLEPGDTFAIMSGQPSAPNLQSRVEGVMSVIDEYPGVKVLPTLFCDDKSDVAVDKIRNTMAANPNLRGWLMVGGWALFVDGALDSITDRERTKVVAVDALEQQWQYLENGQAYCLVAQRPFAWGEESVKILYDLVTGKKTDYPDFVESGFDLIFNDPSEEIRAAAEAAGKSIYSLAEYAEVWKEWASAAE